MIKRIALLLLVLAVLALLVYGLKRAWAAYVEVEDGAAAIVLSKSVTENPVAVPEPETNELLPDLLVLPARDFTVTREGGITKILFSTTYYNRGRGALELKADHNTQGIRADHERKVFQRIYLKDGTHEDALVGIFEWHQEHLHYHFTDFVEYDLVPVSAPTHEDLSGSRIKATFCIRDISHVDIDLPNRATEAGYKICGKETQGVSVGWGDTYYYNYPAQFLDVTGLQSGTYRFVQKVNPSSRLRESNYSNNMSSVLFELDMEKGVLKVLEENPKEYPKVEHLHLEDPFGQ